MSLARWGKWSEKISVKTVIRSIKLFCVVCLSVLFLFTNALSFLIQCTASSYPFWYRQTFDISKQNLTNNMFRKTLKIEKGNQNP